ncbi:hypothetical protein EVAR_64241_1 [Eumeta japonica]|uniref:Uncharacterized protein n=1 Tax=Eumeta variegata TaxID=151549 RepID=A0A4C1Z6R8_EUMVA|nr:hypothetical protein EVAR_64241_1 [Eumeta japonica]
MYRPSVCHADGVGRGIEHANTITLAIKADCNYSRRVESGRTFLAVTSPRPTRSVHSRTPAVLWNDDGHHGDLVVECGLYWKILNFVIRRSVVDFSMISEGEIRLDRPCGVRFYAGYRHRGIISS